MKQYPCKFNVGDTFKTKEGRVWHIKSYDGKFMYTEEGAQYAPNHPDIVGFIEQEDIDREREEKAQKAVENAEKKRARQQKQQERLERQRIAEELAMQKEEEQPVEEQETVSEEQE